MAKYEVLFILSPDATDEEREAVIAKFKKYVEDGKGSDVRIDKWGLKTLAYPIKFKKEGHFVLMNFDSPEQTAIDMGKLMLITEGILRHMIVKK